MKTKRKFFLDYFPPPDYLAMPAICLDISDRSMKYIEIERKNGSLRVGRFGLYSIPEGLIHKGEIKQKDELISFLKTIKSKLRTKYAVASLPEEKVFLSRIKFPSMDKSKMRESLNLQLDEYVPISSKEAVFDFEIMGESEDGKTFDVNLAAFPKKFVEEYRDVLIGADFVPICFEMETQAFARAIVPKNEQGSVMVIDFGRTRATFAIVSEGKVQFATTVGVAGEEIEKAIMRDLKISQAEVEKAKREKGFIKNKSGQTVFNSVLPIVSVIKDEAEKHLNYWLSREDNKNKNILKILLCGGESTLAGLPEYLSYELGRKVEAGNPWVNMTSFEDYVPEIERSDSLAYSTVIGLALGQTEFL